MTAKPTFIVPRTAQRPRHILRDLYLTAGTDHLTGYVNVRESQRGGTDPSLWSYLAQIPMLACNYRQPHEISLVVGMHIDCRVSDWTTNLNYKTGKCNAPSVHYSKQAKSDFLFRSLTCGFFYVVLRYKLLVTRGNAFSRLYGGHHALYIPSEYAVREFWQTTASVDKTHARWPL